MVGCTVELKGACPAAVQEAQIPAYASSWGGSPGLGRSLEEAKGRLGSHCKRKGKEKRVGAKRSLAKSPAGGESERGVFEQQKHLVGERGEVHGMVGGEKLEPGCAGPSWSEG